MIAEDFWVLRFRLMVKTRSVVIRSEKSEVCQKPIPDADEDRRLGDIDTEKADKLPAGKERDVLRKAEDKLAGLSRNRRHHRFRG